MQKQNRKINIFLLGLILINLIQSFFTPIINDEAYYWIYSKYLDWGYFDHPPMVGLFIKLSSLLFSGELGVRFFTVILMAITVRVVWELIPVENKKYKHSEWVFFLIVLSIPLFNLYGFITTPDASLLCFSVLYIWAFLRLKNKSSVINILFVGVFAALLIYSKYHGAVVILLSIAFNLKLLKKPGIYLAGVLALVLILPHIYWQYQNDFITFSYHLFQRVGKNKGIMNVVNYVAGTLGVLNPALFIALTVYLLKRRKTKFIEQNKFMIQMFWGFVGFFLLYSFRAKIEAHWVAFAMIPMTILIYNLVIDNLKIFKQIKRIGIITISLIIAARLLVMFNLPAVQKSFGKPESYYRAVQNLADGNKVVFVNSYQRTAKYSFYTGEVAFSDNNLFYRKNQYDILNIEDEFNNQKVLFVGNWPSRFFDTLLLESDDKILYTYINNYSMNSKLKASVNLADVSNLTIGKTDSCELSIYNPYKYAIYLTDSIMPIQFRLCFEKDRKKYFVPIEVLNTDELKPESDNNVQIKWTVEKLKHGDYNMQLALKQGYLYPKVVSKKYQVNIKDSMP